MNDVVISALTFNLKNSYSKSNNNTTTEAPEPTTFSLKNSNNNYNLNSIGEYSEYYMQSVHIEDLIRLFLIICKDVVSIFINSIIKNKNSNQNNNNNNSKKKKINNQEFQKEKDHINYDTDEDYHYDPKEIIYDQDLGYRAIDEV
ncbi:hypothetical protein DICPUDRAFT_84494 [Dictyostelium purpureum]|uniref:Uncharacterized protein n=1 Tax=Dictyostelium purpureum TaxID=5786 RepID=F1A2U4_DICPU|nr:uncharacterized protein DICPUDRAFT_84494 [Dictyostelium purpureum]EGC29478.1 hypothetical protein DICPUDRAFT_84494 [Dictyostelium purpureum]|eukprot:XP_003293987.1 hypothetical protein DICPUDRAFT_84494 [Dictyostelium purpureum]